MKEPEMKKQNIEFVGGGKKDKLSRTNIDTSGSLDKKVNNLTTDEIFNFMELYFDRYGVLFGHLYNSFNKFLDEDVVSFLKTGDHTFFEKMTATKVIKYKFKYDKLSIKPPTMEGDVEPMFPSDARNRNMTYYGKLLANVTQVQEVTDIATGEVTEKVIGTPEDNIPIANIPIMMRSKFCSLNIHPKFDKRECEYDPGGYFIVNGSEKVIISQDRMCENKPMAFIKKDSGSEIYTVQITSKSYRPHGLTQVLNVRMKKDGEITIKVPILNEINVFSLFRALGIETDRDIINMITYNENDFDMVFHIKNSLEKCVNDSGMKIQTSQDAIEHLITKLRVLKKYTETDKVAKIQQKKIHLNDLLKNNFLPHIENNDLRMKAYFLGYMINKLLKCYLGRIQPDDRDSYLNKRIDLPGDLMMELFKQFYRKMLNDCNKFFKKRNQSDDEPLNIIHQIKPNIIEQGIRASLSTGAWPRRKGVAQVLQRLTYLYTLTLLRRVDAPGGDASTSKLTGPRQLHPSSVSLLCCLTGDSEVLQSNGIDVKQIKDMKDGDAVVSVYKDTLDEAPTLIHNYFSRETKKLLQIKTISGRLLKCTPDHPLLVRRKGTYEMIDAEKLSVGDEVIIRHINKLVSNLNKETTIIKSTDVDDFYKLDLANIGFLDKPIPSEKLEIIARLFGANITDGNISKIDNDIGFNCRFHVGELNDAYAVFDDIQKLGFGTSMIKRSITNHTNKKNGIHTIHKTWRVEKNGVFAYFMKIMGTIIGKKTETTKILPNWIKYGSMKIKQEFLSGFFGGDGCKMVLQYNKNYFKLAMNPCYQTCSINLKEETMKFMTEIIQLLNEFSIVAKIVTKNTDDNSKLCIGIRVENTYENIAQFSEYIGYRYCNEKTRKSAPVIEFVKYKRNNSNNKKEKYSKIIELYKNGLKPLDIEKETKIESNIIKRIIENHNKSKIPKARETSDNILPYDEFVQKYYIKDNMLAIPIEEIKEITPELVYDFETKLDSHSFIVNGFVTSNCVQTPEHAKVGLTKHLNLISSITLYKATQMHIIKTFLKKELTDLRDVPTDEISKYTKVFLNGDWLGLTKDPVRLENLLRKNKLNGTFEPTTGIAYDIFSREIKVYCDSGRMYRPVMRVENNIVKLQREHLQNVSLNKSNKDKITSWNDFMNKYNDVIEYIDVEEQPFLMLAENVRKVEAMRKTMIESVKKAKEIKPVIINRYDDMVFLKYSHCEFHESLLIGEIVTNIPFSNSNQGAYVP